MSLRFTLGVLAASVASLASAPLSFAGTGAGSGGGGSIVWVNGHLEPADLHYVDPGKAEIPPDYRKVDFKAYPKALEALQYALKFLKDRSQGDPQFSEWDLENTEFYFVPKLSAKDLLPVEAGLIQRQVAYTREIIDPKGERPIRAIVELLKKPFDRLVPDYQALILGHELMHHKPYGEFGQHTVISPMIKDLSQLLPLKHKQDAGDRRDLTDEQLAASQEMLEFIDRFRGVFPGKVTRKGGGELRAWGAPAELDQNFIDLISSFEVNIDVKGPQVNVLINSRISVGGTCVAFTANTFQNSNFRMTCDHTEVTNNIFDSTHIWQQAAFWNVATFSGNRFENVEIGGELASPPGVVQGPSNAVYSDNLVNGAQITGNLWLSGSQNTIKTIQGRGNAYLVVRGNKNDIENVQFGDTTNTLVANGQDQIQNLRFDHGGALEIGELAKILHADFLPGVPSYYPSCDVKISQGSTLEYQPIQCGQP